MMWLLMLKKKKKKSPFDFFAVFFFFFSWLGLIREYCHLSDNHNQIWLYCFSKVEIKCKQT